MAAATKARRVYLCDRCGRKLKPGRWIKSRFTGSRYCPPGTGCFR